MLVKIAKIHYFTSDHLMSDARFMIFYASVIIATETLSDVCFAGYPVPNTQLIPGEEEKDNDILFL